MDLCGLASTFSVQVIFKSALVCAFWWAFLLLPCAYVQALATHVPMVCGWPEPASVSALHARTSGVYRVLIKPRWLSYLLELPVKSLTTLLFAPNRTTTSLSLVCLPLSSQVNLQCVISNESPLAVTASLVPWLCCCPGWTTAPVDLAQDVAAQESHRLTGSFPNWVSWISTS